MSKLAILSSMFLWVACGKSTTTLTDTEPHGGTESAERAGDASVAALLEEAAADALVAVVVRPERWAGFRDALAPHIPSESRARWSGTTSVWSAMVGSAPVSEVLPSLDASKPVVLGLFVTGGDVLEVVAGVVGVHAMPAPARHRALLPALDAGKLVGELEALAKRAGVPLLGGEEQDGAGWVSLHVEGDHVRVEFSPGEMPPKAFREVLKGALAKTPKAALEATAGRQLALAGDAFVSFIAWPQRLRDTFGAEGAHKVGEALQYVEPEMSEMLRRVGVAEVLSGWPLLAPERALTHDVAFAWDGLKDGLAVRGVASLTAYGVKVFDAGAAGAMAIGAPNVGGLRVAVGLSAKDLLAAVELPAVMVGAKEDALLDATMRCGMGCRLSGQGMLAMVKGIVAAKRMEALLPSGVAIAMDDESTFAAAMGFAGAFEKAAMPMLNEMFQGAVASKAVEGGVLVTVNKGLDPEVAFSAKRGSSLITLDLALGPLTQGVRGLPPMTGRFRGRLDRSGATLVTTAHLAHDVRVEAALEPRDYAGFGPATAPKSSAATECLERAVVVFADAWMGMANVDPGQAPLVAAKANVDAMGPLACAEADASTKAQAARLREIARVLSPMPTP